MGTENFRVDLDSDLASRADALFARRGIARKQAVTRILSWWLGLPESMQQAVLDQLPGEMDPDVIRYAAEQLAQRHASSGGAVKGLRIAAKRLPKEHGVKG